MTTETAGGPALADVTVLGTDGNPRRLGDFWASRPALLLFVRHFG
jgi:hypothetical protein